MKQNLLTRSLSVGFAIATLASSTSAFAADTIPAINGKMEINFNTRKEDNQDEKGNPKPEVKDVYKYLNVNVGKSLVFNGTIERYPLVKGMLGSLFGSAQEPKLTYDLKVGFLKGATLEQIQIGNVSGIMKVDQSGKFRLDQGANLAFTNNLPKALLDRTNLFGGVIVGKKGDASLGDNIRSMNIRKIINGKQKVFKAEKTDPMVFENLVLASGPVPGAYPKTTITSGSLIYDYGTDTWSADGITLSYVEKGVQKVEVLTGTIAWSQDANYESNRKSKYQFNLVFSAPNATEAPLDQIVAGATDELSLEDLTTPDFTSQSLMGEVLFDDSLGHLDEESWVPERSLVEWKVQATKTTTEHQIMTVFKLLGLVGIGPFFDE